MEESGCLPGSQNAALVVMAFLQADCRLSENNPEYCSELLSLGKELNLARDVNGNGAGNDDGNLETDGHFPSRIPVTLLDIQPLQLEWPRGHEEAAVLQEVAEGLRYIAAQFELRVVAQATQNLHRNIADSAFEQLKYHLKREVDRVMKNGVGLEHLPQERVMVALSLTLVKGVCEQTPWMLRSLFNTVLQLVYQSGFF